MAILLGRPAPSPLLPRLRELSERNQDQRVGDVVQVDRAREGCEVRAAYDFPAAVGQPEGQLQNAPVAN